MLRGDRIGLGALAIVATLVGCASPQGDDHLDVVFDPCVTALEVADDASDTERNSVAAAAHMWNGLLGAHLVVVARGGPAAVAIRFEVAAPLFRGVYLDEEGVVVINRALSGDHQRAVTIAHELGHAFGLWHTDQRASVMNPGNLEIEPNFDDGADLAQIWGACPGIATL